MSGNEKQNPAADVFVGGDKTKGAAYIAANPSEYGFTWGSGAIGKGVGVDYVELRADCPWIDVKPEQVMLFTATFGAAFVSDVLKGQSIKVRCDRVNRASVEKNKAITNDALREKLVTAVLLQVISRTGGTTTKYVVGGQVFATQQDADKFSANAERIKAIEAARDFMAMASDNNIDPVVARNMAKAQWPLAFVKVENETDENDEQTEA